MRKAGLLNLLEQVAAQSELEKIDELRPMQVIGLLLDYINDKDVEKAVDAVVM